MAAGIVDADDPVTLVANGRVVQCDPAPMIEDGRVYVPLRAAARAVGGKVTYYPETKSVTICTATGCTFIEQSDGLTVEGSLLLGLRKLGEALLCNVDWNNRTKIAIITTPLPSLDG